MKGYQAVRDVEELFRRYEPLRKALLREYRPYLTNEHTKEELESFIKEHFIRLCYEYDTAGEVDFSGYIKIMLGMRIKYSFVGKEYKDTKRMTLGGTQDISETYESEDTVDVDYNTLLLEFKDIVFSSVQHTPLTEYILDCVLLGDSVNVIVQKIRKAFPETADTSSEDFLTARNLRQDIRSVRSIVELKGEEWLS